MTQHCSKCRSLGIVRMQPNGEENETLGYCGCEWSKLPTQIWKLPSVNMRMRMAFDITPCPLAWFLPNAERQSVPRGQFMASVSHCADLWKARVRKAEKFWEEYAQVFDAKSNNDDGGDGDAA